MRYVKLDPKTLLEKAQRSAAARQSEIVGNFGQQPNGKTHGFSTGCLARSDDQRRTYNSWMSMKQRCLNKNHRYYQNYGGRGIAISRRWLRFEGFLASMGLAPAGQTLERRNNDRGYSKRNCLWASRKDQANNRSSNRRLTAFGKTLTIQQWSEDPRCSVSGACLATRLNRYHWPIEKAITAGKNTSRKPYDRKRRHAN